MGIESILWRRLDAPGHDACRVTRADAGWRLDGVAAFSHEGVSAGLAYTVQCDADWRTRQGDVRGWIGQQALEFQIVQSSSGAWTLNGQPAPHVGGCIDLDFGFTPATNLIQLRRVNLDVGQAAAVPVAWLDVGSGTLDRLQQRYERRTHEAYWYEAPRFGYADLLQVGANGFVEQYPTLWAAENTRS